MSNRMTPIAIGLLLSIAGVAHAQPKPEGYLCCNMYADGDWISDSNYREQGKKLIPLGTPARVTDYGRYRVFVEMANLKMRLGNDYSRNLPLGDFAERYIVAADPAAKLATYPANVQTAIKSGKVMVGMTKEQVLMSLGYPIQSENPSLDAPVWRYWLSSYAEFQLQWDARGRVQDIAGDVMTRNLVVQPGK